MIKNDTTKKEQKLFIVYIKDKQCFFYFHYYSSTLGNN